MSNLNGLINEIETLIKDGNSIKEKGKLFLSKIPINYKPSPPGVISIGFSRYSWAPLNENLKSIQSELRKSFKLWHYSSLKIVVENLPEEKDTFSNSGISKDKRNCILDYIELSVQIWKHEPSSIINQFDEIMARQIDTLAVCRIKLEKEKEKFNSRSSEIIPKIQIEEIENSSKGGGELVQLEKDLINAIYDQILKNPDLYEKNHRGITQQQRTIVMQRDANKCQICGNEFPQSELDIDHIYPFALGGSNNITNLMLLCRQCNMDKGKSLDYYRSDEGREKIKLNIKHFVRSLTIISNFGEWLKQKGDLRRRR